MGFHTWYISMASGSNLHCLQYNGIFANCQICKQKPDSESQAVFFLAYALPAAIRKKTNQTPNLEGKFFPKLHLCNLRDLECFFLLLLCCPTLLNKSVLNKLGEECSPATGTGREFSCYGENQSRIH